MFGCMPAPATPETSNEVFERSAALLREAFDFAHQLGVKTCVGTETPLIIPTLLREPPPGQTCPRPGALFPRHRT